MRRAFVAAQRMMPRISVTERIALRSGTKGVERFVFDGTLSDAKMRDELPTVELNSADRKMLAKLPALLRTVDEYAVAIDRKTSIDHPFWAHAKREGFFGLIVPDEFGGNHMSKTGLSKLLQRVASASASASVHVMVPASLGPAELLAAYGTEAQKHRYLPQLAEGAIPCFGLTSLDAGSDAAGSMVDVGRVIEASKGRQLHLECEKRYITLAPVADLVGIAFKIEDPNGTLAALCGRPVDGEITLALVERGRKGMRLGPRSDPLGVGFANGTVTCSSVILDVERDVIGGLDGVGKGWQFLMEALAAGRGIALPAGAAGAAKLLTNATAGYAALRVQFKQPLVAFEGVQDKLADMASKTYEIDSLVRAMNCALDAGERPPVFSAILKQRTTELGRDVTNHAMDILAGSAICMGPQNFAAPFYMSTPIGITVEGSNTMTRSLLIFGQGIVRSHPYLLGVIDSLENDDPLAFRDGVFALVRDTVLLFCSVRPRTPLEDYVRFFALSSTMSLLLGGNLKRNEFLSARYADMLSFILGGFAMRWHPRREDAIVVAAAAEAHNLWRLQEVAKDMITNHPHKRLHAALYARCVWRSHTPMSDMEKTAIAKTLATHPSSLRDVFDEDTLPDAHANVKRISEWLRSPDASLARDILRVDVHHDDKVAVCPSKLGH